MGITAKPVDKQLVKLLKKIENERAKEHKANNLKGSKKDKVDK